MLCSDEDWVIRITFTCSRASMENKRPLKPAFPTIPLPCKFNTLISLIDEIPFIGRLEGLQFARITVPLNSGSNVFLITMGIFFKKAGIMVGG